MEKLKHHFLTVLFFILCFLVFCGISLLPVPDYSNESGLDALVETSAIFWNWIFIAIDIILNFATKLWPF